MIGLITLKVMNDRGQLTKLRDLARPLAGAPRALWGTAGIVPLAATVLLWGVEGSVYLTVAKAVGFDISATGALYLVGLTNFVAALPAAPGSIGTFDAAVIFGAARARAAAAAWSRPTCSCCASSSTSPSRSSGWSCS